MATTTKNTYSPSFRRYLDELFIPAQDWARSEDGIAWIAANAPTLAALIDQHYDDCLFAVYVVKLNEKALYVGESIRTVRRLVCHAYNIAHYPGLFGLECGLGGANAVTFELLDTSLYDKSLRKRTELYFIELMKPLLQAGDGTDNCIPRSRRGVAVAPYYRRKI